MKKTNEKTEEIIYVSVLDEDIGVWCPVFAENIKDNIFLITKIEEKHKKEPLEFNIGDKVITTNKLLDSGNVRKIAISKIND